MIQIGDLMLYKGEKALVIGVTGNFAIITLKGGFKKVSVYVLKPVEDTAK